MKDEISPEDFQSAVANIARTTDGRLLYLWLQKVLMGVSTSHEPGALQIDNGRRMFAAELMGLMSQAMAESTGAGNAATVPAERPIVFAVRPAVNASRRRSAREYLAATAQPAGSDD